ncbi:hypothetical protein PV328_005794 [Microctonus aethiopoides]|uniref:Structural maintenance of chromosomes protein n=1 Tax=Microctonus aethiopoides TaxID=144406 RepID=A0AA39FN06_9HYME|nr:hypothetical protein PV328_005794 [Microctonus aethiopoides]
MSTYLYEIHICNFKSFDGIWKIGPLKSTSLSTIIGSNGTGKSNILEAFAFCMGEQSINLRVTKVKDLVNRSKFDTDRFREAFVTCIFQLNNGNKQTFKRCIIQTGTQYEIDGKIITKQEYHEKLNDLGICIKARNFIIYQNEINSIMSASEKERTKFFEQISHSIDYKEQYDYLKNKFDEISEKIKHYRSEKTMLTTDQKNLIYAQNEGKKLLGLQENYEKTLVDSMLFELYIIELLKNKFETDLKKMNEKKKKLDEDIEEIQKNLQSKKSCLLSLTDSVKLIEDEEDKIQKESDTLAPDRFKIEQQISKCEEQLKKSKKKLEFFIKAEKSRECQLAQLSEELEQVTEGKKRFIKNSSGQFEEKFGKMEKLNRKYDELQEIVAKRIEIFEPKLNLINYEMQPLLNKIDNEKRKRDEITLNINKKKLLNEENKKRICNMQNCIQETERKKNDLQNKINELDKNINIQTEQQHHLQNELEIITEQCTEYIMGREQRNRIKQENQIVESLRQSISGVHDRVYKLLKPIHERYKIAFTKVFGPHFSNIIVNNTETALECIKHLRKEKIGTATFLPLDENLKVEKLKEHLRSFYQREGIKNVVLLHDVIAFEPEFERIVLHIAGNILVCETDDVAKQIAYMSKNTKYNCVTLNGTYYRASGLFSGGRVTLEEKSTMLKTVELEKLEIRRIEIREKLKKMCTNINSGDLQTSNKEVEAMQHSLEYLNKYLDAVKKESENLQGEISELNNNLQTVEETIASIEVEINELNKQIEAVQVQIHEVEDEVYADFCIEVNIPNIRKYKLSMRSWKEIKQKELEYDEQCARIESLLSYEKERKTNIDDIQKWQENMVKNLQEIEQLHDAEKIINKKHDELKNNLDKCRQELIKTLFDIENLQKEIAKDEETLEKKFNCQKMLDEQSLSNKMMETFGKRHDILLQSKIYDRALPLVDDTVLDTSDLDMLNEDHLSKLPLVKLYEQEDGYEFDYSRLKTKPKSITQELEIYQTREMYKKKLKELESMISIFEAASKVSQELMTINEKLKLINSQLQTAVKIYKHIKTEFKIVQKKRYDAFMKFFENVAQKVDDIYKEINDDASAQALLYLENTEEPYLGGTHYDCTPPGKCYNRKNLSGGEIAVAALSLIFAIQNVNSSPFLLLDEIDAAFDQKNRKKVISYIKNLKNRQQIILISLRKDFFSTTDTLIGVYPMQDASSSSNFVILDLPAFTNQVKSEIS